jgi:hypothetical protein
MLFCARLKLFLVCIALLLAAGVVERRATDSPCCSAWPRLKEYPAPFWLKRA